MNAVESPSIQYRALAVLPMRNGAISASRAPALPVTSRLNPTPDRVQPFTSLLPGGDGTSPGASQGGFFGLIRSLIGRLDTYIQSLDGGTPANGVLGSGTNGAVAGQVYLE
jgi:hypothetical protein